MRIKFDITDGCYHIMISEYELRMAYQSPIKNQHLIDKVGELITRKQKEIHERKFLYHDTDSIPGYITEDLPIK